MKDLYTYVIYLSLLLIGVVLCELTVSGYKCKKNSYLFEDGFNYYRDKYIIIFLVVLALVVGFRYKVGVDWYNYVEYFNSIIYVRQFEDQRYEWGFYVINKIISYFGGNYQILFFSLSIVSWFFIVKSVQIKTLTYFIFFMFCLGYLFWSMNVVRQFLVIGIWFYALRCFVEEKKLYYIILVIIGGLFHQSIYMVFCLSLLFFIKKYDMRVWMLLYVLSFLFYNSEVIKNAVDNYIMSDYGLASFLPDYEVYFESKYYLDNNSNPGYGVVWGIVTNFMIIWLSPELLNKHSKLKVYYILFTIGVIGYNLFSGFMVIERVLEYLLVIKAYLLSVMVFFFIKEKKYLITMYALCAVYLLVYIVSIYNSSHLCSPYEFTFSFE